METQGKKEGKKQKQKGRSSGGSGGTSICPWRNNGHFHSSWIIVGFRAHARVET
jgi:hypothetical protein